MELIDVKNKKQTRIVLGREGENHATKVQFDFSEWANEYGSGVITLVGKRAEDIDVYPIALTTDGNIATWLVSDSDVAQVGYGEAELIYSVNGVRAKSRIFTTVVMRSIDDNPETPEPYQSWVDMVIDAGVQAQVSSQEAKVSEDNARESELNAATSELHAKASEEQALAYKNETNADRSAVASDRATIEAWKNEVEANKDAVALDKQAVASDKQTVANDKATVQTLKAQTDANAQAIATDKASVSAMKSAVDSAKTDVLSAKQTVEVDASQVATDKATVVTKASEVSTNATQVAQDKQTVATDKATVQSLKEATDTNAEAVASDKASVDATKEYLDLHYADLKQTVETIKSGLGVDDFERGFVDANGTFYALQYNNEFTSRMLDSAIIKDGLIKINDGFELNVAYYNGTTFHHRDNWVSGEKNLEKGTYNVRLILRTVTTSYVPKAQVVDGFDFALVVDSMGAIRDDVSQIKEEIANCLYIDAEGYICLKEGENA